MQTRKIQPLPLRRVRDEVRTVERPFRCDGPDLRREMDIRIAADKAAAWSPSQPRFAPKRGATSHS